MRLTQITIPWADGEYTFDMKLGQVRALQEKTGLGPGVILARLQTGDWKVDDYRETLLQGLLGGGMTALDANKLIRKWVDDRPAKESLIPAQAVLMAWIMGAPTEKKDEAPETMTPETKPGASTSAPSTEPPSP